MDIGYMMWARNPIASQATSISPKQSHKLVPTFLSVPVCLPVCPLPSAAMAASSQAEGAAVNDFRRAEAVNPFVVEEGQDENSSTFIFGNEDHTFGNPLRHILIQNPETDFCGYSVPHPYEPKLNLRLQTKGEKSSLEVLSGGLMDMEALCNVLESKFNYALEEFHNVDKTNTSKKSKR